MRPTAMNNSLTKLEQRAIATIERDRLHLPIWEKPEFVSDLFMHKYSCKLVRVVDADTLRAIIGLGLGQWQIGSLQDAQPTGVEIRLARINAWEKRGSERSLGIAATNAVKRIYPSDCSFRIFTYRDKAGKYGRLLADIEMPDGACLNDWLVKEGHARYQHY